MEKYCSQCGDALKKEGSPCPNCAKEQQVHSETATTKNISQMTIGEIGQSVMAKARTIQFDAADEDNANVKVGTVKVKIGILVKVIAIALCVIFFLPLVSVEAYITKVSINGWTSAFGKGNGNGRVLMALLFLLVPAALFLMFQFKKKIPFIMGKLFLATVGLSTLGIIALIVYAVGINHALMGMGKLTFWFYLSFVLYILTGFVSAGCLLSGKKR